MELVNWFKSERENRLSGGDPEEGARAHVLATRRDIYQRELSRRRQSASAEEHGVLVRIPEKLNLVFSISPIFF